MKQSGSVKKVMVIGLCLVMVGFYWSTHRLATWWVGRPVAAEQKTQTAQRQQLVNELKAAWKQTLTTNPADGDVDIAVYDNTMGTTAQYTQTKPGDAFAAASVIKLSILETLLLQNQKQHISGLTSSQLAEARPMIENSDNDAATSLWNDEGKAPAVNSFFKQIGASDSQAEEHWGLSTTTALDQLKVIDQIAYPKLLLSSSASSVNTLLDGVESDQRWGVSGGVPSGVSVRLKDGWLEPAESNSDGWVVNSMGHVSGNDADYTIAVLTSNNQSEWSGINTVQALSAATWTTVKNFR